LKNPEYKIRAVTRNASSDSAKKLAAEGAEIVVADSDDIASLKTAFQVKPPFPTFIPKLTICPHRVLMRFSP
jgi:hypothetical protein